MKSPNALLHVLCIAKTCSLSFFQKNLILFVLLFSSYSLYSQQLAFPTAAGFGKHATGGRGGSVIKVTNLNASGSGSLKAALEASGTRTVVFEVGGTIDLAGTNIYADDGNLTIAGQTAPGDGILVKGGQIRFAGSNVICRYLRVRPGAGEGSSYDGINITSENGTLVQNIIIDHCSISWAKDENFAIQSQSGSNPIANVTLQNSIVSECTYGSLSNINTSNLTFYRNLFAFNSERNIENQAYSNTTLAYESINNIYYGFSRGGNTYLGTKFTSVNNKYKLSSQISFQSDACISEESGGTPSQTHAYISGNIYPNGVAGYSSAFNPYIKTTPYISSGITPISASALEADILGTVGCGINRDAVDTRIINLYTNGNGTLATSGTYPTINGGTAPADSDNDGMPNTWEIANGLNPNNASDRNIVQADGYTNLEYYLNGMTLGVTGITADAGQDVSICQGSGTTLTATGGSTYQWSTGATTASITVSPNTTTTYTVTAFDATGNNSDTDDVTVTVNPIPNVNAGLDVTITVGTSVTLTATGANSYLWSTGSTSQSINVSPLSITTYTVTGTTNGCEDTDSVTVFLIDTNVNANAGNDVSICEGGSTTLTATGGFNYQWSTGATTESITVSPNTTTTYTVTAFGLLGINSDTDDVTVTVNPLPGIDAGANVTINLGESTTLSATGGDSYQWNTGATTASIDVSPSSTTTYTVTGTSNGCDATDTVTVTVIDTSVTAHAGADVSICEGSSATLTATGGSTYEWSTGETTASITVSPDATTTYTVTAFDATGTNSDMDDVTVTVNPTPIANAGNDVSTCRGTSVTLTASGGDTYLWETGATTASITVNPGNTRTYTVEVTQNGCTATDDVTVTVNPLPGIDAGANVTLNLGDSVTLSATGGNSYQWNTGATTASIDVSPSSTTTYTVTGTSNGCDATDTVTVTVIDTSVTANAGADVSICEGSSATLTATGGSTYEWSTGETTASITVSPDATTTYTVTAFDATGTNSDTDEVMVTVNPTPIANAGNDVSTCRGTSVTLTASGGDTYLWETGATTASITVNPGNTRTYTVEVTQNGCTATDDVTVTVNPLPSIDAGANVTINLGESVTLTATGGNSYQWSTGETTQASLSVLLAQLLQHLMPREPIPILTR
ncbi:MAG: hypothetical protein R2797_07605 [Gelidibacter sp.]